MGDSYRIRTEIGTNQTINVNLEQDFEFLEILSLKIQQADVYTRSCADYGVVVGRVFANGGFGVPNAKVSVFIPIDSFDRTNPIINNIYPYQNVTDKNQDGYRYNLLPSEKSYSTHEPTGTFPSRLDVLTGMTEMEIYDKYYRFTCRTNDSGDYMIMGVPLGFQTLVMDIDLSDIGEFSLTPQDLIRMGIATETQVAGNRFRASNDLNSLPQILNLTRSLEIFPLWGDPDICQITINRADFDLRNDANIEIQPTSIFMGSIFSSPDKERVRPGSRIFGLNISRDSRPKDNLGNLCNLQTNTGQILAIRQTIFQDEDGNPILEEYRLEQLGNIIDGDGTWLTELPMNLDYVTTNEFGDKVISYDPELGIPTKGKYRFKIKWQQPSSLQIQTRRAYFLVPNIKEYGWIDSDFDINFFSSQTQKRQQKSSYYFGLNWSGYTDGFIGVQQIDRLGEIINCEDTFYEFKYNKVYTISSFIDQFKNGGRSRFIGIKEIDSDECAGSVNKFPVNEGVKNYSFRIFIASFLLTLAQIILISVTIAIFVLLLSIIVSNPIVGLSIIGIWALWFSKGIKLPMITYPECTNCECGQETQIVEYYNSLANGTLTPLSFPSNYSTTLNQYLIDEGFQNYEAQEAAQAMSVALGGNDNTQFGILKIPRSRVFEIFPPGENSQYIFSFSYDLPLGERINVFNQRKSFFDGINKIKVSFAQDSNIGKFHFDNTITVLSTQSYEPGELLTFIDPSKTFDRNYKFESSQGPGITGTTISNPSNITVKYAVTQQTDTQIEYFLPSGSTITNQKFPTDIEYYQVLTALTISQATQIWETSSIQTFPNIVTSPTKVTYAKQSLSMGNITFTGTDYEIPALEQFDNYSNQYVLIIQRGVDPYSPKFNNEYRLGKIFGHNIDNPNFIINIQSRLNIPIQKLTNPDYSVQQFDQNSMYYNSYFFQPGNQFVPYRTLLTGLYGAIDAEIFINIPFSDVKNIGGVNCYVSDNSNDFYGSTQSSAKYDGAEDFSGKGFFVGENTGGNTFGQWQIGMDYYSPTNYFPDLPEGYTLTNPTFPFLINDKLKNIIRTDRIPSSDGLDGESWSQYDTENNQIIFKINGLLQQNNNFRIYSIEGDNFTVDGFETNIGDELQGQDLDGLPGSIGIIESFSCQNMVDLSCYEGFGENFGISPNCDGDVENGCYVIWKSAFGLIGDVGTITEWAFRYRFFNALCQGVLSQTFTNNWVNGTLFAFPIQINNIFNINNQVSRTLYPRNLIYFDTDTFNFYYRSSPYRIRDKKFIGKSTAALIEPLNEKNLLFPTTIIDLGMKDSKFSELTLEPYTKSYVMPQIPSTTYDDTSDLVNLYVISRIGNSSFLTQISEGINSLFRRFGRRVGGDLTQLMSVNSEVGVIKFSPEYYESVPNDTNSPTKVLGTESYPTIAVWYSSTTEDLQVKDYLTPGVINFRGQNITQNSPFVFGIKSQRVPFYQWQTQPTNPVNIFGNEFNNWSTDDYSNGTGIFSKNYQSLYRVDVPPTSYFQSGTIPNSDIYKRGYIFSTDASGNYSQVGSLSQSFLVGAPFHFYFGVKTGFSALDKFKTKYLADE
jgi:hypothetical protein